MKNLLIILGSAFALMACEEQGPLEQFGEEVDESIEDVRAGGETLGNRIDDAGDEIRDAAEDVREELERQ